MLFVQNSDFSANVTATETEKNALECHVSFTASPHGGLARLWFHFCIVNDGKETLPATTRLTLKHLLTMLGAAGGDFRPVIRYGCGDWERLPKGSLLVRPDGYPSVEWTIATPKPGKNAEIAFCYPYEPEHLSIMRKDTGSYWNYDEIGVTTKGRNFYRLANRYGSENARKPGCYLIARQHAAETSGAWVLDGVLRRLAEIKADFPVWCVAFADPDGVVEGNYGKDSFPQDLNRAWGPCEAMRHEIRMIATDMQIWKKRVSPEHSFILDFHSPGACEKGLYAYIMEDLTSDSPFYRWTLELGTKLAPFSQEKFIKYSTYKPRSSWGNFHNLSEYAYQTLQIPSASFEASYFEAGGKILSIKDYQAFGAIFADHIAENLGK